MSPQRGASASFVTSGIDHRIVGAMPTMPDTEPTLIYETEQGRAFAGDAIETLQQQCGDETVDLVMTSPPFALARPKDYGNQSQDTYVRWFQDFADEFWRVLKPSGSLVIDLGSAWQSGSPVKSLYQFELLISLCRRPEFSFHLAQDFYWYNPARLPSPAQWVTIERVRAKDSINYLWWLSKSQSPKADNSKVTGAYGTAMKKLLETGTYNRGKRPSGHVVSEGFTQDRGGAIQPNLLVVSNTSNDNVYREGVKEDGLDVHPARYPEDVPRPFIEMLTDKGDLVLDPFAGSNVTGLVSERLGRQWMSVELNPEYVQGSRHRFTGLHLEIVHSGAD
jgi:site-specific DNA-methyltransferase (cytosine-N4-specific)